MIRWSGRLAAASLLLAFAGSNPLHAEEAKEAKDDTPAEAPAEYRNWVSLEAGGTFGFGSDPQGKSEYQRRYGLPAGTAFGGVEDFHYEQDVGKRGFFTVDGHAVFDNRDYGVRIELSQPDIGFVRTGYREFRTYYNGAGGYFPLGPVNAFTNLYSPDLAIDHGQFFFEAGLTIPDTPEVTLRYAHEFRNGQKDSTVWGDSNLTGGVGTRAFVPSFRNIDEVRDIFSLEGRQTVDKTDVGIGLAYEHWSDNNSLNIQRRPGEPQGRYVTQTDETTGDMFNFHASSQTRFTEKVSLAIGYSHTVLDTDLSGSRIYGPNYDPVYDPGFTRRQVNDQGFLDLSGFTTYHQNVGSLNLMWTPWKSFVVVPAVRVEGNTTDANSQFVDTNVRPGFVSSQEAVSAGSDQGILNVSESLEMRYVGFTNWVLYARGYWLQGQEDQNIATTYAITTAEDLLRAMDYTEAAQQYTLGANWYPCARANLAVQAYYKTRSYDYDNQVNDINANRYPGFLDSQDFATADANIRLTLRPLKNVSVVGRYDYQTSTIDTQAGGLPEVQSADITSQIFSLSASWNPWARLWIQAGGSYVIDETKTPASTALATPVVLNSDNNYWNLNATCGFVVDDKTDLQVQYFYYRASNYEDNALYSMPYGVSDEEQGVIGTLTRRFTRRLRGTLKYGYFANRDQTSGGLNNYYAQMVSTGMTLQF